MAVLVNLKSLSDICISLENFSGPMQFLMQLAMRRELPIEDIALRSIATQFQNQLKLEKGPNLEEGAEFIGAVATLSCLKSRALLPAMESPADEEHTLWPASLALQQIVAYSQLKQVAQWLLDRDMVELRSFPRPPTVPNSVPPPSSLPLGLDELLTVFLRAVRHASPLARCEYHDPWNVAERIVWLRSQLVEQPSISASTLFCSERSCEELIALFLALLEMVKRGEATIKQIQTHEQLLICAGH